MRYLITLVLLAFVGYTFAGTEVYSERIERSGVAVPTQLEVFDARYVEMDSNPLWANTFTNYKVNNKVQLGYIYEDFPVANESTTVRLEIESWKYVGSAFVVTTEIREVNVFFDANGQLIMDEKSTIVFNDAHRIRVTIQDVQGPNNHLYLEASIDVERYYSMSISPITNYGVNTLNYTNGTNGLLPTLVDPINNLYQPELQFWWDEVLGAEEYELEWLFISNYDFDIAANTLLEIPSSDLLFNFYNNGTRVQIKENNYTIPGVFNRGYIVYRVRPIGRQGSDFQYRKEGNWTYSEAGNVENFDLAVSSGVVKLGVDYSVGKNWAHSVSYSEEGKRFEAISYMDGMGRGRQILSHNTVTEQMVVNNAYYDKVGRPVISDLPTPKDDQSFSFRLNFNYLVLDPNGTALEVPFTLENYLLEANNCELPNPMSLNRGAGQYYSANNPNQSGANANIPNANGYPFSKAIYLDDPTGRMREVGGFGLDLQTSVHGTKMYYETPTQDELNRLFGTEVGLKEHYQKTTTIDANGQAYIQYTDLAGRVIATALSGESPENLLPLENNTGATEETTLVYENSNDNNLDPLIASYSYQRVILEAQTITLSHDFDPAVFEDAQCINGICFDCHYDFEIKVERIDCPSPQPAYFYSESINGSTINEACNTGVYVGGTEHQVLLEAGEYSISKTLKVNEAVAQEYWCLYTENADVSDTDCLPDFTEIYNFYYDNADFGCTEFIDNSPAQSPCDMQRRALALDMSVGGQYGEIVINSGGTITATDQLSIYNLGNALPNGGTPNTWRNPSTPYVNNDGTPARIYLTEISLGVYSPQPVNNSYIVPNNGNPYILPEHLGTLTDFVTYAQPNWGASLVEYHPEYCYLQFCETKGTDFHAYTELLDATESFDQACSNGAFAPVGSTTLTIPVFSGCNTSPTNVDEFFTTGYFTGTTASWAASYYGCVPEINYGSTSDLTKFYELPNGDFLSIWEYSVWQVSCPDLFDLTAIQSCIANTVLDDCNKEQIWNTFKEEYSNLRYNTYLFAQTAYVSFPSNLAGGGCGYKHNGCIGTSGITHNQCFDPDNHYAGGPATPTPQSTEEPCGLNGPDYSGKSPNFANFQGQVLTSAQQGGINTYSLQGYVNNQLKLLCQEGCTAQADEWMERLSGCNLTPTQLLDIKNGLIEVCAAGCDIDNIQGASSLPGSLTTGTPNYYTSFEGVLFDILGPGYETAICSDLLISSPSPYGTNPVANAQEPLDDCACDKVLQAKYDLANNPVSGITDIVGMLAYNEGITYNAANGLACICEEAFGGTWTPSATWTTQALSDLAATQITIPQRLSCAAASCTDCATMNTLYSNFLTRFGSSVEQSANYELLLENFMNRELEFNLSADQYINFIESCNATTTAPFCALTNVAPVLTSFMDVLTRRGRLTATTATDFSDNVVYQYSNFGSLFVGNNYTSSTSGNTLTMNIGDAQVFLTLPSGADFTFDDILSLSSISPVECTSSNEFTLVATIMECGELVEREINGQTDDFEIVSCYCGSSAQTLCNSSSTFIPGNDCYIDELIAINHIALTNYQELLDDKKEEFISDYLAACASAFQTETLVETSKTNNYQFTLFYYDQAGNLIQTVAPKGVDLTFKNTVGFGNVNNDRTNEIVNIPSHTFKTVYEYNAYNQLVSTTNPDQAGNTKFWYDRYGRIIASQNPVQAPYQYSYSIYDLYGRPVEVGQANRSIPGTVGNPGNPGYTLAQFTEAQIKQDDLGTWFKNWVNTCVKTEVTITSYDEYSDVAVAAKFKQTPIAKNLRLRVAGVRYYTSVNNSTNLNTGYESATYYNYDQHGNVTEQIQDIPMMTVVQQNIKSTQYEFELLSGNVEKVIYQEKEKDQFTHEYYYDQLNRLTEVFTSEDGVHSSREAHYYYYDYGPLARTEIGDHKVQGQDYAYTINGWMKALNGSKLDPSFEMGKDGTIGYLYSGSVEHSMVAKDVTAYTMGYFEGDYASISGNVIELATSGSAFGNQGLDLFNGNIRHLVTSIVGLNTFGSAYSYDQLNRLKEMQAYQLDGTWANTFPTTDYFNSYSYDENGNMTDLQRNGAVATNSLFMDQFSYSYGTVGGQLSNQLNRVTDTGADDATSIEGDIKSGQQTNNYQYDALGQLTKDVQEGITSIVWRKGDKKIKSMTQNDDSPDLEFYYNPFGIRIAKLEKTKTNGVLNSQDQWKWTYYSYDANGQCMAVYEILKSSTYNKASLAEQHIYGSSRLGMLKNYKLLYNNGSQLPSEPINKQDELGLRRYELTNHLGNVQAVINDRKIAENQTVLENTTFAVNASGWQPCGQASLTYNATNQRIDIVGSAQPNNCVYKTVSSFVPGETYTATITANYGTAPGLELSLFGIGTFPLLNGVTTDITFTANSSNIALIIQPTDYAATYSYSILDVKASTPLQYEAVVVMTSDYYPFGMKMPGGLKAGAQPTGTYDVLEEEVVNYSNLVNSTVNASRDLEIDISGTGGSFSNLYGANSQQTVEPGEYIEWKAGDGPVSGNREFVGLSYVDGGTVYTSIKYAWYLYPNGRAYIFENGANVTSGVIYYTPGSVFRITRNGGNIVYTLDGIDYATIAEPPGSINDPMIVDISLINISGVITTVEDLMVAKWHTYAAYDPSDFAAYVNYDDYRYAYNGMEQDNEVSGNGNSYTTEFRQYDPRLGRWKSLDPLMSMFPHMSPYVAFDNNPIYYVDPYGLSAGEPEKAGTTDGEIVNTGTEENPENWQWNVPSEGDPYWAKVQNLEEAIVRPPHPEWEHIKGGKDGNYNRSTGYEYTREDLDVRQSLRLSSEANRKKWGIFARNVIMDAILMSEANGRATPIGINSAIAYYGSGMNMLLYLGYFGMIFESGAGGDLTFTQSKGIGVSRSRFNKISENVSRTNSLTNDLTDAAGILKKPNEFAKGGIQSARQRFIDAGYEVTDIVTATTSGTKQHQTFEVVNHSHIQKVQFSFSSKRHGGGNYVKISLHGGLFRGKIKLVEGRYNGAGERQRGLILKTADEVENIQEIEP